MALCLVPYCTELMQTGGIPIIVCLQDNTRMLCCHTHTHKEPAVVDCRYWCCTFVSVGPAGQAVWVVMGKSGILRWKKLLLISKPFILLWHQALQNLETFLEELFACTSFLPLDYVELQRNVRQKSSHWLIYQIWNCKHPIRCYIFWKLKVVFVHETQCLSVLGAFLVQRVKRAQLQVSMMFWP